MHCELPNAAHSRTYYVGPINSDYYNLWLYESSRERDDDGVETHTVISDGVPMECTIWYDSDFESRDGIFRTDFTWTASVPKGYDGLVVGFFNRFLDPDGRYLSDYYTTEDDFALYRMK